MDKAAFFPKYVTISKCFQSLSGTQKYYWIPDIILDIYVETGISAPAANFPPQYLAWKYFHSNQLWGLYKTTL